MGRRLAADIGLRLALLVGLGVSSALLLDYIRPLPAFCEIGSGCDRVRTSGYGALLGIPVPLLGVGGFATLLALSLSGSPRAQHWTRGLSLVAGAIGLGLLTLQAVVLGVFCRLCVTVDVAAVVTACAALARGTSKRLGGHAGSEPAEASGSVRRLWALAGVSAVAVPALWSVAQPMPPVPPEIARLWRANAINVVEFADFQCPFCRELHPLMTQLLKEYEGRVHFVRLNMPLPSHNRARDAARAYVCADEVGRGAAMADALFTSEDLGPEACARIAVFVGIPETQLRACVASPATDARIEEEIREVKAAGLAGLPTVWIGEQVLVGARPIEDLRDAFEQAAHGARPRWPLTWLWGALAAGLVLVAGFAWTTQRGARVGVEGS